MSPCCNAPIVVAGTGLTHWYACSKCWLAIPDGVTPRIRPRARLRPRRAGKAPTSERGKMQDDEARALGEIEKHLQAKGFVMMRWPDFALIIGAAELWVRSVDMTQPGPRGVREAISRTSPLLDPWKQE